MEWNIIKYFPKWMMVELVGQCPFTLTNMTAIKSHLKRSIMEKNYLYTILLHQSFFQLKFENDKMMDISSHKLEFHWVFSCLMFNVIPIHTCSFFFNQLSNDSWFNYFSFKLIYLYLWHPFQLSHFVCQNDKRAKFKEWHPDNSHREETGKQARAKKHREQDRQVKKDRHTWVETHTERLTWNRWN